MKILTVRKIGGLAIICLIILGSLYIKMERENTKCLISPFTFGADEFHKNNITITCECTPQDKRYKSFYFDRENITMINDPSFMPVFP